MVIRQIRRLFLCQIRRQRRQLHSYIGCFLVVEGICYILTRGVFAIDKGRIRY